VTHETSSDARHRYDALATALAAEGTAAAGKMFGMPVLKAGSKAFAGYYEDCMTFKLGEPRRSEALALPGAKLFDPMGGRPMREWVQVPVASADRWRDLADAALAYVGRG